MADNQNEKKKRRGHGEWSFGLRPGRDGQWQARKQFGKKENGKPNIVAFYGRSKTEVKNKAMEYEAKLLLNQPINASKETVYTYVKKWLENVRKKAVKPRTYDGLEDSLEVRLKPYDLADVQMKNISVQLCQMYINKLTECNKKYSIDTIRKSYNLLNAAFKYAVGIGDIAKNPMEFVVMPSEDALETKTKDIKFFTEEQMTKIYEEANLKYSNGKPHYYFGLIIEILARTGIRINECLALKWSDVDYAKKTLNINKTLSLAKNRDKASNTDRKRAVIKTRPKTEKSIREVRLSEKAINAFEKVKKQSVMFGLSTNSDDNIFQTHTGNLVSDRNVRRSFDAILEKVGIPDYDGDYGLHTLRHTYATTLLTNGIDVNVVSEMLGHKKVSTTYNIYAHVIDAQKRQALDVLDKI